MYNLSLFHWSLPRGDSRLPLVPSVCQNHHLQCIMWHLAYYWTLTTSNPTYFVLSASTDSIPIWAITRPQDSLFVSSSPYKTLISPWLILKVINCTVYPLNFVLNDFATSFRTELEKSNLSNSLNTCSKSSTSSPLLLPPLASTCSPSWQNNKTH